MVHVLQWLLNISRFLWENFVKARFRLSNNNSFCIFFEIGVSWKLLCLILLLSSSLNRFGVRRVVKIIWCGFSTIGLEFPRSDKKKYKKILFSFEIFSIQRVCVSPLNKNPSFKSWLNNFYFQKIIFSKAKIDAHFSIKKFSNVGTRKNVAPNSRKFGVKNCIY